MSTSYCVVALLLLLSSAVHGATPFSRLRSAAAQVERPLIQCSSSCNKFPFMAPSPSGEGETILDVLAKTPEYSTFYSFLLLTNVNTTIQTFLDSQSDVTVYPFTNDGFSALPPHFALFLKDPANVEFLTRVMSYHVAAGTYPRECYCDDEKVNTTEPGAYVQYNTVEKSQGFYTTSGQALAFTKTSSNFLPPGVLSPITGVLLPAGAFPNSVIIFTDQRAPGNISFLPFPDRSASSDHLPFDPVSMISMGYSKPEGLAADSKSRLIFWSDDTGVTGYVSSLPFSGSTTPQDLISHAYLNAPQGLDVDPYNQRVYVAEYGANQVSGIDEVGGGLNVFKQFDPTLHPSDVKFDPHLGTQGTFFVYVENKPNPLNGTLMSIDVATQQTQLWLEDLVKNYGFCIDTYNRHLYYLQQMGKNGLLQCAQYGEVECAQPLVYTFTNYDLPTMCTVDTTFAKYGGNVTIFATSADTAGNVRMISPDGASTLVATGATNPYGITLASFTPADFEFWWNLDKRHP